MSTQLRKSKFIALILTFAMVLNMFSVPAFAVDTTAPDLTNPNAVPSANRANVSFVYLGMTSGPTVLPGLTAQTIPTNAELKANFKGNQTLWVGLQFSNLSKVRDFFLSGSRSDGDGGLSEFLAKVTFDNTILQSAGVSKKNAYKAVKDSWTVYESINGDVNDEVYSVEKYAVEAAAATDVTQENILVQNRSDLVVQIKVDPDSTTVNDPLMFQDDQKNATPTTTLGDDPVVVMVFGFKLASGLSEFPENNATPILQGLMGQDDFNMILGYDRLKASHWHQNMTMDTAENTKHYFNVTNVDGTRYSDGVIPIIEIQQPLSYSGGNVELAYGTTYGSATGETTPLSVPAASGGTKPYSYALTGGSSMPTGLTLNADGTITGTPTVLNTTGSTITVTVTDKVGDSKTATVTIKVKPFKPVTPTVAAVAPVNGNDGKIKITNYNSSYTYEYSTDGGTTWNTATVTAGTGDDSGTATFGAFATNASVQVRVKADGSGTYTASDACASVNIPPATPTYTITAKSVPTFTAITYGDSQPAAQNVVFTNSGNQSQDITATLTGANASSFTLTGTNTGIAANADATFAIQPKANLKAGTYKVKVKAVSTNNTTGAESAEISFTVNKKALSAPSQITGISAAKKGATGAALQKTGTYQFATADGVVGSDVVTAAYKATYTAAEVANTATTVTLSTAVTMDADTVTALTGADKDNYTFAGATNIQGVGSVIDKVITGIQVTTAPTKMSYASGETIDLTGMVVKVTYDNDSTDTATFTAANASFSTLPGEIKIKVAATGGDIQITGGTTATQAMNNLPLLAYTDSLTAGAATPTNLTISAAAPKSLESISADPTNNFTAGTVTGDGTGKLTYAHDTALDLTGLKAKVKHSDNLEYEKTFAELTAMGIKVYVNGTELTGNITAAMDGKTVTLKDPNGTITGTLTVGTIKIGKTAPTVTFGNTNQTFGSTYTAVTATINNNTASTVDLSSSVKYVVPSYTTGAVDAVACNKTVQVACNHTTSDPGCAADCTYVAGTPCTETVACNHDTVQAADCPASGVICNVGDPTACLHDAAANCALYQARQSCTKTVACNHNTSDPGCAASCTYVAGTPCTKTVEVACNHNTSDPGCAPDCTYVAGSAGTTVPSTEVTAMTDPAMAAYLATLTTADCPVSITVKVAQAAFTGDNYYDALAADAIGTLTLSAPSTGGGGGGGGSSVSTYTVKFDAAKNGTFAKDAKTSVKVEKNSTLAKSDVPTVTAKEGYKFIGWSLDGKTVVDPTAEKVTKSVTYTALYKENLGDHTAYMNGNDKGEFKPDANITRAEAAALLARLVPAYDDNTTYTGTFSDVNAAAWYANEVFFDVKSGYITGYADGSFKPGNNITRQEFAIIVARYLGMENEGTSSFADCDGVYAEGYISQLVRDGIITGYVDGTFRPNAYITRAEAVKVLNSVFDRVPDKAVINEAIDKYDVKLVDVSKRHWAYYEILEAAIDHEISDFHA